MALRKTGKRWFNAWSLIPNFRVKELPQFVTTSRSRAVDVLEVELPLAQSCWEREAMQVVIFSLSNPAILILPPSTSSLTEPAPEKFNRCSH